MGRGKKKLAFLLTASGIMLCSLLGLLSVSGWSKEGEALKGGEALRIIGCRWPDQPRDSVIT